MNNFPLSPLKKFKLFSCHLLTVLLALSINNSPVSSQETSSPSSSFSKLIAQDIIPPHPDAIGGGNPLQGLGRPDDPEPSRVEEHLKSLNSSSNSKIPDLTSTKNSSASSSPTKAKKSTPDNSTKNAKSKNVGATNKDTITKAGQAHLNQKNGIAKINQTEKDPGEEKKNLDKSYSSGGSNSNQRSFVPAVLNTNSPENNSPHRRALALIQTGKYTAAQTILEDIKITDKSDLKARYLLAIIHVMTGQNKNAIEEYKYVIKHSQDPQLTKLAELGLERIILKRQTRD